MVRKAEFDESTFILSAVSLISAGGPNAATMAAIAQHANAPTGSIYHRFKSRTVLLAAAWHTALQEMSEAVLPDLYKGDSLQAVSSLCRWTEQNPEKARVIMLYDENDLIEDDLPADMVHNLGIINRNLGAGLTALLKETNKALSAANLALVNFAIFDGPIAAMKPLLRNRLTSSPLNFDSCQKAALACCRASMELLE